VPNHVCNAVNLADSYVLTDGGTWRVAARGRNN
jgi:D-serine deaminase-like pyridoxal phosphate-dependent protein